MPLNNPRGSSFAIEAWQTPTLQNSWLIYSLEAVAAPGFYKDPLGIIWLRGAIRGGASNSPAFTLPIGYRPPYLIKFICAGANNNLVGAFQVEIRSNGGVAPVSEASDWLQLEGIQFRSV